METNKLRGNSTKYAKMYFTHSCEPLQQPHKINSSSGNNLWQRLFVFFWLRFITLALRAVHIEKLSQPETFVNQEKGNIRRQPVWQKTYPATTRKTKFFQFNAKKIKIVSSNKYRNNSQLYMALPAPTPLYTTKKNTVFSSVYM